MIKSRVDDENIYHESALKALDDITEEVNHLCISHQHARYWFIIIIMLLIIISLWMTCWRVQDEIITNGILIASNEVIHNHQQFILNHDLLNDKIKSLESVVEHKKWLYLQRNLTIDDLINSKSNYLQARSESYDIAAINDFIKPGVIKSPKFIWAVIDWQQGSRVKIGMKVNIVMPASISTMQYQGVISAITSKPLSVKFAIDYASGLNIADQINHDHAVYFVLIKSEQDENMIKIPEWTPVNVKIQVRSESPFSMLSSRLWNI